MALLTVLLPRGRLLGPAPAGKWASKLACSDSTAFEILEPPARLVLQKGLVAPGILSYICQQAYIFHCVPVLLKFAFAVLADLANNRVLDR